MFQLFAAASAATQTLDNLSQTVKEPVHALQNSFAEAWKQVADYAPRVVAMVVVLIVGYLVARLVAWIITQVCDKIGVQHAADSSGLAGSMQHMGIKRSVSAIVGTIVFWLMMCVFFMAAFEILNLPAVSAAMGAVALYIPKLLVATVVVVGGLLIASFLRGLVATSADRLGLSYAEYLAAGCYYVLAVLTFYTALTQLGMDLELFKSLILISFAGLAAGFGLAFGLGGRDVIGGILAGYYVRQRLQAGDHVTIGRLEGFVREVGPVATIIESDEDGLLNRHSIPNTRMLNEAIR
jgi:Conserved TM helix/Mechanosensitive ion channel